MGSQPHTQNDRQLRNAESKRKQSSQGKVSQQAIQQQAVIPEDCIYIFTSTTKEKEARGHEEKEEVKWGGGRQMEHDAMMS